MQEQFWKQAWEEGRTGFHGEVPHQLLVSYRDQLKGPKVLVPLCGKSLDLLYLHGQNFDVTGVELSDLALDQFESEHKLSFERTVAGSHEYRSMDRLKLICGNFFSYNEDHHFDSIYDRAAAIALPKEMRQQYYQKLDSLLTPGGVILMIIITAPKNKVALDFGPPFFIPEDEIREAFKEGYTINCLANSTRAEVPERYREAGIDEVEQRLYYLQKKA